MASQFYVWRNVDVDPNVDPACKYRWMNVFIRFIVLAWRLVWFRGTMPVARRTVPMLKWKGDNHDCSNSRVLVCWVWLLTRMVECWVIGMGYWLCFRGGVRQVHESRCSGEEWSRCMKAGVQGRSEASVLWSRCMKCMLIMGMRYFQHFWIWKCLIVVINGKCDRLIVRINGVAEKLLKEVQWRK